MERQMIRCVAVSSILLSLFGSPCASHVFKTSVEKKPRDKIQFAFAKHFQDHMVLQQAPAKANIYGFSPDIGQLVTLQITSSPIPIVHQTTVKPGPEAGVGVWGFTLDPTPANTTISLKVSSKGTNLTLSDVIFGDVWICSGQSNMEFTVKMMAPADAAKELADAHNYPLMRLMTVELQQSTTPLYDLVKVRQPWTPPSNASIGGSSWKYFSAVCWLYGKAIHKALGHPIGLIATSWGGTPVEAWSSPQALAKCGVGSSGSNHDHNAKDHHFESHSNKLPDEERLQGPGNNSVLWNAMIHPMLGMTIKGAVWYQGESDSSGTKMDHYNCTFPAMIQDWRNNFNKASNGQTDDLFPFGFVQLSPYRPNPNISVGYPDIRWHQTADHGYVPNTDMLNVFMAVAMDLPDYNSTYGSIHPQDKKDVGDRLALAGLAIAYGRHVVYEGPFPLNQKITSGGLVIDYGKVWNVTVRSTDGFELLCVNGSKGTWIPTKIVSNNHTSVTLGLTCSAGHRTAGVRYAWRESPCEFKKCAIYETVNGLPGPPFVKYLSASGRGSFNRRRP
ncbi:hypothetical protein BsWGS_28060 [Bradybaena similaris]